MNFIKPNHWETLTVNAPVGFITYFLKKQNKLKAGFSKLNLEATQFKKVSDRRFSIEVYQKSKVEQGLEQVKNSLFNQLPVKTPAQAKEFIEVNIE